MGLIDLVQDLEAADAPTRFQAATALYRMGAAATPAIPKLVNLLRDIDGVNVPDADGSERLVTVAERAALALAAIGETAAGPVVEEMKKDNAVSAIHCVRALSAPALAKRVPVPLVNERLMRPKVSPAMQSALCEVLYAACQSTDEAQRNAAKSAFKAAYAAGRVTQKFHRLFQPGGATPAPATPAPAAPSSRVMPPPPPAPTPAEAAIAALRKLSEEELRGALVPGDRPGREERPTAVSYPAAPSPVEEPERPAAPPRVVERPMPPVPEPAPTGAPAAIAARSTRIAEPTAEYQPDILMDKVKEAERRPIVHAVQQSAAAPVSYGAGERFAYRAQVGDLLRKGDKLKAVNVLRQHTGASLVEALKQIEAWT